METKTKEVINEFEYMRDLAELKALSNYSLENVPTEKQYKRMMELAKKLNIMSGEWTT